MDNNKGPVNLESVATGEPTDIPGREVNPDKDDVPAPNADIKELDEHLKAILEHVPEVLRDRVKKLGREELSMPGLPRDREAYEAYLGAEKMLRDLKRRETKKKLNFDNLPRETG